MQQGESDDISRKVHTLSHAPREPGQSFALLLLCQAELGCQRGREGNTPPVYGGRGRCFLEAGSQLYRFWFILVISKVESLTDVSDKVYGSE